jgi:HEAT repeat protein
MEPLSPQVMHKLVFTILVHGLPDAQTGVALDVLTEALNNPNGQVRELAVVALAELPVPAARRVAALAKAIGDGSGRVRRRAARALGDFGAHALPALPRLSAALKDPDPSVRRDAAGALGRLGPASHTGADGLVGLLAEQETRTRVVAATALKRIGRAAVPALLDGLRHRDPELRGRCATVLGQVAPGDLLVEAALLDAATDSDAEVRRRAGEALGLPDVAVATPAPVGTLTRI